MAKPDQLIKRRGKLGLIKVWVNTNHIFKFNHDSRLTRSCKRPKRGLMRKWTRKYKWACSAFKGANFKMMLSDWKCEREAHKIHYWTFCSPQAGWWTLYSFLLLFILLLQEEEYYICIYASRNCDTILFTHEGGVDVGDVDAKVCCTHDYDFPLSW